MIKFNYRLFLFLLSTALFGQCAHKNQVVQYENKIETIYAWSKTTNLVDSIVRPYKEELDKEVNILLGLATCGMSKARPEGALGNFVADIVQKFAINYLKEIGNEIRVITMLNNGGLRTPINEGDVLLRNIFELMPFDNQIVLVRLSPDKFQEMISYIERTGGEPISGFRKDDPPIDTEFWIATSDYLADGGDKMVFFKNPLEYVKTGVILRDEIANAVIRQGVVCSKTDGRWY